KRYPEEYQQKKKVFEVVKRPEEYKEIDLWYFDVSGFCLVSYIHYAWQEKGQPLRVATDAHSKRLNVLGFFTRKDDLQTYTIEGKVDSAVIIACIDDFCQSMQKKSVIVMDQSSLHTSKNLQQRFLSGRIKN